MGGRDKDEDDWGNKHVNKTLRTYELAKKIVKFERKLAQASLDSTRWFSSILLISIFRDVLYQDPIATYNPVPMSNLTKTIPHIHFRTYFSLSTPRAYPDRVTVTYPAYSVSLSWSDRGLPRQSRRSGSFSIPRHDTETWQAQCSPVEPLTGVKKGAVGVRAEYCVGIVEDKLGFAVGRYFVNDTFRDQAREKGTKIITGINKLHLTSYYLLIPHKTL